MWEREGERDLRRPRGLVKVKAPREGGGSAFWEGRERKPAGVGDVRLRKI